MTTTGLDQRADGSELLDGRYRLGAVIGRGGYAAVHRATDEALGREVAVKLFTVETPDERDVLRRQSETRLLAALNHPSLVTLFDARLDANPAYLVMELIDGPTLRVALADGPMPTRAVARLTIELSEALQVIHAAGIVHRDIKPSNVLLRPAAVEGSLPHATLTDFGIASLVDATRLTATGTLVGTAAYLSPEQAHGRAATPASDVYSLGLLVLEALTGRPAFAQDTPVAALLARIAQPPTIPPQLPDDWRALLSAMTSLEPQHRPGAAAVTRAAARLQLSDAVAAPLTETQALPVAGEDAPPSVTAATKRLEPASLAEPASPATDATVAYSPVTSSPAPAPSAPARKGSRRAWVAGIVVLLALAIVAAVWGITAAQAPTPSFPPLPEPLGTHFEELWDTL